MLRTFQMPLVYFKLSMVEQCSGSAKYERLVTSNNLITSVIEFSIRTLLPLRAFIISFFPAMDLNAMSVRIVQIHSTRMLTVFSKWIVKVVPAWRPKERFLGLAKVFLYSKPLLRTFFLYYLIMIMQSVIGNVKPRVFRKMFDGWLNSEVLTSSKSWYLMSISGIYTSKIFQEKKSLSFLQKYCLSQFVYK